MRTIVLLPLTALVAVVAGCGSDARERATRAVPERDLTLMTQTLEVPIASPVEMPQLRDKPRATVPVKHAARRPVPPASRVEYKVPPADVVLAVPEPVAQPVSAPANDRELLPGNTITVIPASSGPSPSPDATDDFADTRDRTMVRGGGTCRGRGRGPGIGIATAPRPDFR